MKNEIHEYEPNDDVIFNLIDEASELTYKIIRLKNFLTSGKLISHDQREYLLEQYDIMMSYVWILFQRINDILKTK